jgi:hypothetical protein
MYVPQVIITDKLKNYGVAKRKILPEVEHRQHRYLNNRAEDSHQPTQQRERRMQRFKSQVMPNGSSPPLVPSCSTSAHVVTDSPRLPTGKKWRTDSTSGGKSRPRDWRSEGSKM